MTKEYTITLERSNWSIIQSVLEQNIERLESQGKSAILSKAAYYSLMREIQISIYGEVMDVNLMNEEELKELDRKAKEIFEKYCGSKKS